MREILFRGKRVDNGAWVEGNVFIPDLERSETQICIGTHVVRICYAIDPETIGQFTGLTDKNGTKIFEGYIVKTKYGRLCIVVWFSSQVTNCWDLVTILTVENCTHTRYPDAIDLWKKENLEVIGNIHDKTEELLKES